MKERAGRLKDPEKDTDTVLTTLRQILSGRDDVVVLVLARSAHAEECKQDKALSCRGEKVERLLSARPRGGPEEGEQTEVDKLGEECAQD